MADPENFEDDLFADLYDDNDTSAAQASVPSATSQPQPPVEAAAQPGALQPSDNGVPHGLENGYGDDYQDDNYEEDDDVDFNLGNGPTTAAQVAPVKQEETPTPSFHTTRGPSAKEDGT
ncbi:hypothetical protein GGR56DRAFT_599421 [Xylariaceae sp. FL0804]|nr:hypothetical protein GGR56DRAFT_599421 [Xylariaceae sp. FL0804]